MLAAACHAAGVSLGAFDQRVLSWAAEFEDASAASIAGLITRAAQQRLTDVQVRTVLAALDIAADLKRDRVTSCPECEAHPDDRCADCVGRLDDADEHDALAELLGSES